MPSSASFKDFSSLLSDYEYERFLGEGSYAKVMLAVHRRLHVKVAIKCLHLKNAELERRAKREVQLHTLLCHKNVIRVFEVIEGGDNMCIVMEYAQGGDVYQYLISEKKFSEAAARSVFREMVSAVGYCHSQNVVHRDLKAENFLLDRDFKVKLADFGFSKVSSERSLMNTHCGSKYYVAPEIIKKEEYRGEAADLWSLGVILYCLYIGKMPFEQKTVQDLVLQILSGRYAPVPPNTSPLFIDLLNKLLETDPTKRATTQDLIDDPWLNINEDPINFNGYIIDKNLHLLSVLEEQYKFDRKPMEQAIDHEEFNSFSAPYYICDLYEMNGRIEFMTERDEEEQPKIFFRKARHSSFSGQDLKGNKEVVDYIMSLQQKEDSVSSPPSVKKFNRRRSASVGMSERIQSMMKGSSTSGRHSPGNSSVKITLSLFLSTT
eukprot:Lithocolla_globosa_v1_NODE_3092_length_1768_cov_6.821366.p1 type:complete len:434 gc:universal NODE_3092_length_1768_cov_6.821366:1521-220(-)